MIWHSATLDEITTNSGAQTISDVLTGLQNVDKGDVDRVIRILLKLQVRSSGAGVLVNGRFGLVRVTQDAFDGAAVPDPAGDLSADWLFNEYYTQIDAANVPVYVNLDIRSGRTLRGTRQTFSFVLDAGGSANSIWSMGMRLLFAMR